MWMRCGVHMFHPVNGRRGFDLLDAPDWMHAVKPPREIMAKLLQEENDIRRENRKYLEEVRLRNESKPGKGTGEGEGTAPG